MESYTNISSSMNSPEVLGDYKSQFINGCPRGSRTAAEVCLRQSSLESFWRSVIEAVRRHPRGDIDGAVFTSADLGVCLGPWDVDVRHHYEWIEKEGGDSYAGHFESYGELNESYEVIAAYDAEYDEQLTGLPAVLNAFYEAHKMRLHNI